MIRYLEFKQQAFVQRQTRTTIGTHTRLIEAAKALKDQFGARLDVDYDDGRSIMVDALRDRFGISARDARQLVEALASAPIIRRHPSSVGVWPSVQYDGYWQR